jgi:hypothetical protein
MFFPWMFAFLVLGLVAGGGIEVIAAPTRWATSGLEAPRIMEAQVCALEAL